ncbi:MAG: FkbM family methyltransferase [Bacteroidota bacterium]|nr:FkbM family methyltransferase [Bacteroidota bacterium]
MFKKKKDCIDPLIVEKNERIFYIKNINEGNIVFDVGANIGELTLLFSSAVGKRGQVHSFEPTPETFNKLSTIIKIANKKNVRLNNKAVAQHKGNADFNVYEEEYSSWNTFAKRPLENYGIKIAPPLSIVVPVISIDDYCRENFIESIDLLKIDVEGAELNVLKGAERMFQEKKISQCVFEFGQTIFDMGNTITEFEDFFKLKGYKVYNVSKIQNIFPIDNKTNSACFAVLFAKP